MVDLVSPDHSRYGNSMSTTKTGVTAAPVELSLSGPADCRSGKPLLSSSRARGREEVFGFYRTHIQRDVSARETERDTQHRDGGEKHQTQPRLMPLPPPLPAPSLTIHTPNSIFFHLLRHGRAAGGAISTNDGNRKDALPSKLPERSGKNEGYFFSM